MATAKELYKVKLTGDIKLISKDSSGRQEKINYIYESPAGGGLDIKLNLPESKGLTIFWDPSISVLHGYGDGFSSLCSGICHVFLFHAF